MKRQNLVRLLLLVLLLVVANVISSFVFTRFDLTTEKRFTLSKSTRDLVSNLNDVVYVRVYLDGDFPPSFKRLQNATREMLDELRAYSNGNLEYQFINPSENPDEKDDGEYPGSSRPFFISPQRNIEIVPQPGRQ